MHIFVVLLGWLQLWWRVNQKVWFCYINLALRIKYDPLQLFTLCCATSAVEFLQAVQSQLQSEHVLGWFAYRPVTSLKPTTQECMISSSMAAALGSLQVNQNNPRTLFAVISCLPRHEGSSCDFQQCMFQLDSRSHELEPIDVQVRNVGEVGPLAQRYQPVMALPMLSSVPAFTLNRSNAAMKVSSSLRSNGNEISVSMLRNVAYTGLQNQVYAVESMYRKTVRQLELLAHKACIDAA
ncbi:TPA: hypothetical protein ACH3X1_001154 [Trebouxia sp. C0004]